jgi:hypothetical protein
MRSFLLLVLLGLSVLTAHAQTVEQATLQFFERIDIERNGETRTLATAATVLHDRQEVGRSAVRHQATVTRVAAKMSELGELTFDFVNDETPDAAFRYSRADGIEWLVPTPAPPYIGELNRIILARTPTDLTRETTWSIRSAMQTPDAELPLDISVEPFEVDGQAYAVLRYTLAVSEFRAARVSGAAQGHGFFVVSADFRDLYYSFSSYDGEMIVDGSTQPFSVKRGLVRQDDDGKFALSPRDLPRDLNVERDIGALSPDRIKVNETEISTPDPLYGVAHALTEAFDARIGVEAENRGNPIIFVIAAGISVFNTVDDVVTATVNITGRTLGNKGMTNFEGMGASTARFVGELAGSTVKIVFKNVDKKAWGENATKIWDVTGVAADGVLLFTPGGAVAVLGKVKKVAFVGKIATFLDKDKVKIAAIGIQILNDCTGAFLDDKDKNEKIQDCVNKALTAIAAKAAERVLKKKLPPRIKIDSKIKDKIPDVIEWGSDVIDLVSGAEDEDPKPKTKTKGKSTADDGGSSTTAKQGGRNELQHARPLVWPSKK